MRATLLFSVFAFAAAIVACGSIPDFVFVPDDASATRDGGGDAADGGAGDDASTDGGNDSGANTVTCGGNTYPPEVTCCTNIACLGDCHPPSCKTDCASLGCASPKVCCHVSGASRCVTPGVDSCP